MQIDLNNPQWLAVLMAYRNVNVATLAAKTGLSPRGVQLIRNGKSDGSLRVIKKIAAALDCTLEAKAS